VNPVAKMNERAPITSDLQNTRVRLEPDLYERLRKIAEANERHVTQEIRLAVRKHVEDAESK
jgi:predicted DNA-binding protein